MGSELRSGKARMDITRVDQDFIRNSHAHTLISWITSHQRSFENRAFQPGIRQQIDGGVSHAPRRQASTKSTMTSPKTHVRFLTYCCMPFHQRPLDHLCRHLSSMRGSRGSGQTELWRPRLLYHRLGSILKR
jgi:hypothetical protein